MGYYDGIDAADVALGEGVHARRQFLHGRVRRLVPQPPVADLRVHAATTRTRPPTLRAQIDERGWLKTQAGFAGVGAATATAVMFDGDVTPDGYSVNTTQPP